MPRHGGNDPGAVSGDLKEKDLTLKAANYMYQRLQELGVPAVITRDFDEDLSRSDRLKRANEAFNGDPNAILISNHINAGGGEGVEVVYGLRNTSTLARNILESIGSEGQIMRKYYQRRLPEDPSKDYYYIIRETNPMQSLLVEYGFIDNANDQKKLEDDLLDYVEAVVRAISQYAGYPYIAPSGSNTYTVKSGDSLWSIANKFNITVAELKEYNNLSSNNLSIGQILKIPTTNNDNSNSGNQTIYTVKRGDSLWSIASNYGVSVADLRKANNLTSDTLTIGQILKIPIIGNNDGNVDTGTSTTYTVKRGDNLYSIARKYNVSVDAIKRANNLESDVLSLNQVLIIPNQENNNNSSNDSANTGTIIYTVKRGDSLWSIANNYGISVLELKAANNLTSNLLSVGQTLIIPSSSTNANYFNYTVKSGDSLWSIANQFGVSVLDIKNINNLTSNLLVIGQILKIPNS